MQQFIAYKMGQPNGHVLHDGFIENLHVLKVNSALLVIDTNFG